MDKHTSKSQNQASQSNPLLGLIELLAELDEDYSQSTKKRENKQLHQPANPKLSQSTTSAEEKKDRFLEVKTDSITRTPEKRNKNPTRDSFTNLARQNSTSSKSKNFYSDRQLEAKLKEQKAQIDELYKTVNTIFPLITAILQEKSEEYHEAIRKNLIPIIDQIIAQRSLEDQHSMASAIADILPGAITHEIKQSPTAIAKAIAPEVAMAIKEQINLDRQSISDTLGPEMGQAIKTQINVERDAMVDALYPVIGNTISKYMVEVVKSINQQVENALSIETIQRKIKAKIQGVSEAELIVAEAVGCVVQAAFLIQKTSGLVIATAQQPTIDRLDADLLGGMLTAIRSFANEYIGNMQHSELCEIDYGDAKILLEVAGYAYLAVVVKGEPTKKLIKLIRQTLSRIALKHEPVVKNFDGDPSVVPSSLATALEELIIVDQRQTSTVVKPNTPVIILLVLFALISLPLGFFSYRNHRVNGAINETAQTLYRTPELSVYGLDAQVRKGSLVLTGRLPNEYLRQQAERVVAPIAQQYNFNLDNQVVTVRVPPNPQTIIDQVERVTDTLNQNPNIQIRTDYQTRTVTVSGKILSPTEVEEILAAYRTIECVGRGNLFPAPEAQCFHGIENLISNIVVINAAITPIYFDSNSVRIEADDENIDRVMEFLANNPDLNLRLVGYADPIGTQAANQNIARQRAMNVEKALIDRGVEPARLKVNYSNDLPPGVTSQQPLRLRRAVYFEPFFP